MKVFERISWYLLLVVAFVLGLKQLHEPDLWWMFRTGEWMVQNSKIPTEDVFSYTLKGTEWISVKWLFELIAYGLVSIAGPESISLLQSLVNVLLVILFARTVRNFSKLVYDINLNPYHPFLILGSLLFLFFIDYRLTGRPEMTSILFVLAYLHLFIRYRIKPGKFIFWLIPLQILWVNLHEGFAVGIVLLLAFGIGNLLDFLITKQGDKKIVQQLLVASLLAVLAVAINPRGFYMFYHPYFLFSVVGSNHFTTELNSVFFKPYYFFSFKEPYFAIASFVIAILAIVQQFTQQKTQILSKISLGYIGVIFAFLYLGTTGYRNLVFPILLIFPFSWTVVLRFISKVGHTKISQYSSILILVLPLFAYGAIVTNFYYENFRQNDRYGLVVYAASNPSGAAKFAKENGLADKRCFSDYLTSSFYLWNLRPGFESFIDLRDLDIFPPEFFNKFASITTFTNKFDESDQEYNYDYAMLYSGQFPNLHRYLYHSENWRQVYADNISAVYVKNNPQNAQIINKFRLDSTNLLGHYNASYQPQPSLISNRISSLFWPLFELTPNKKDTSITAAKYFRMVADFDRAEFHAQNAINNGTSPYLGWVQLGNMYLELAPYQRTNKEKIKYITLANNAYTNGVNLDKTREDCIYGQAKCATFSGNYGYAIKRLKKVLAINPKNATSHTQIAQCYTNLNQTNPNRKNTDNWFLHMEMAYDLEPYNQDIIASLALAYCQQNRCEQAKPLLIKYERSISTPESSHIEIMACMKKCRVNEPYNP